MPQQTGPSVDLMEYQAKELFALHGVPVLPGETVDTAEAARGVAERIGRPVVVKAQVKTGGRGKAGGVKLAATPDEAVARAHDILGLDIRGHVVHKVLVTEASEIDVEYYVAFLLDRANRGYLAMASAEGGMEIEQLAVERPDALARIPVDPIRGCDEAKAREIVATARIPVDVADEVARILLSMWQLFIEQEATLVEINPLCRTPDGRIVALDGKVTLDDSAEFRHADVFAACADVVAADDLEGRARSKGLNYVKLDGEVGIIGNGAGLVMSTLDVVAYAGAAYPGPHGSGIRPANFLDIGGGASAQVMTDGLGIILSDPDVRSVFVNVFGGITSCDAVATGIVTALGILGEQATKPLVVRLDGNNVEQGRRILAEAAHPLVTVVDTMDGAAARAAELASDAGADADADADAHRQR